MVDVESGGKKVRRIGGVLNLSQEGVLLKVRDEIPQHTNVVLRLALPHGDAVLVGRVVHCTPTVGAFKVGIELVFEESGNAQLAPRVLSRSATTQRPGEP